jgi:prolyl-tRNA synthetase
MRGVPLRLEIGPRDLDANQCVLVRRDTRDKRTVSLDAAGGEIAGLLGTMQSDMLAAARARMDAHTHRGVDSYDRFKEIVEGGGFVYAGWNGDPAVEARVKEETKATIRCIPDEEFRSAEAPSRCLVTGEPAKHEVVWARAY